MKPIKNKHRRDFFKKSVAMGLAAGSSFMAGRANHLFASEHPPANPDLVAVKNAKPDVLFNQAMKLFGGMKKIVKQNQTVVVKPNIGFNAAPEMAATTNPLLVKTIIDHCKGAGAKTVYVFDNIASSNYGLEKKCYKNSGIAEAAKSAGAKMVPAEDGKYYQDVRVPGATVLKNTQVHEVLLEADVFINVPILKHHSYTFLTMAMKNLMGVVYDRMNYHNIGLDQAIADFCLFRKPDLNVLDAYRILAEHGPWGGDVKYTSLKKTLLLSKDIVAIDTAAAKIFGMAPEKIDYIKMAHEKNIGNMNLEELKISKYAFPG
jgi:uncharacterized protein (DUF362 family)